MSDEVETSAGLELALGKRLQTARQKAGFTQQRLCNEANLSYSTLAKIERGAIKSPSVFTIQQIATVLGVSLDTLLGHQTADKPLSTDKKTSKTGIKFVYFDINGCLVRFYHRAFTRLAHDTGATVDAIERAFWHYNDSVCRGEMTVEAFNRALAESLNIPVVDWQKYYLESVDPIDEMNELLTWAAEHYHVGLLSNIMPGFIEAMQAKHLLPDVPYTAVVDSSEVNAIKPEEKMYQIAQGLAGVESSEILLVDDERANLMAADRMGWHVLWFDDYRPSESAKKIRTALEFE